jgi:predicted dehydrogenase
MASIIKWGILGCGRIASKFASDLQLVSDAELIAVASRSKEKALEFSSTYPAKFIHGNYEELATNPEVDVIYVATPHSHHHEHSLLCLKNRKAVLCEKAFAINVNQAKEMIREARSQKIFLMEALWTKFLPHFQVVREMITEGSLGEIRSALINFGFRPANPVPARIYDPELGGGSLLDIGIYNVFIALTLLGKPDEIDACMTPAPTGVDEQMAISFRYKNGCIAQLFSSFQSNLATEADIAGNKGRIRLTTRFYEPSTSIEFYPGRADSKQIIDFPKEPGWGYQYEIRHVQECLKKGLIESPVMTLDHTMEIMEVLDEIRRKAGLSYPADRLVVG